MSRDAIDNNLRQVIRDLTRRISALERQQQDVGQLSELSSDMGLQTAGEFRAGNGVEPGEGFSGVRMTADGVSGYDNDVLQSSMSATDGKITAGAGSIILNSDGISITGDGTGDVDSIKFKDGTTKIGFMEGYKGADTVYLLVNNLGITGKASEVSIVADGRTANITEHGVISLCAWDNSNSPNLIVDSLGRVYLNGLGITVNTNSDDVNSVINGTGGAVFSVDAGNNDATIATKLNFGDTGVLTGGSETINDDAAFSFTPVTSRGVLILRSGGAQSTIFGMFTFAAVAGTAYCYSWVVGSATVAATGALSGTTGTDTKVTVSAHTDGKIYIENRSGGQQPFAWQIVAGA